MSTAEAHAAGSADLQLPDELREPLRRHLADLKQRYLERGWGAPVGFGKRPALIVIDLACFWTDAAQQIGSHLGGVIENTQTVLAAARAAGIPVFFTTFAFDPAEPPSPHDIKLQLRLTPADAHRFELDPRMDRQPTEKLIRKRYASAFKGTNLNEMLTALGIDTLIVTGCSTSHCIYATCRDATDSFRVIVPQEAVGERCELMHEVNLLDIQIDLGDVLPVAEVVEKLASLQAST